MMKKRVAGKRGVRFIGGKGEVVLVQKGWRDWMNPLSVLHKTKKKESGSRGGCKKSTRKE